MHLCVHRHRARGRLFELQTILEKTLRKPIIGLAAAALGAEQTVKLLEKLNSQQPSKCIVLQSDSCYHHTVFALPTWWPGCGAPLRRDFYPTESLHFTKLVKVDFSGAGWCIDP